ncbi:MAG TPA: 3-ketoacyl-ACP reductase [Firmicutes bacterium]|nr:3-ketoacyl-ACP reductase [Bacillota bacterium]
MVKSPQKTALVTGAGRGIGRAIALTLADAGFNVVINYARNKEAAQAVLSEIEQKGGRGLLVQGDIKQAEDRARLVGEAMQAFGRIDVLVNNAGVAPRERKDILEATEDIFDEVLATNIKGPYFLTQLVAREMIKIVESKAIEDYRPVIVNITSISASTVSTSRGEYCISKAGAAMITKLYAVRLAPYGIGVYEIRPGIIATDMTAAVKEKYDALFAQGITPIARWGLPEDVAKAVKAIVTGAFPYSTGEVIHVDGGFHLRVL